MSGILLLVLNEGFDDMSLLSCQVILEENGNDVIITSKLNGPIKGENSSVMTVSLEEAIAQDEDYIGIIVVGGKDLLSWELLNNWIVTMNDGNKIIGGVEIGVNIISSLIGGVRVSNSSEIVIDKNIITLLNPENVEKFAEEYAKLV